MPRGSGAVLSFHPSGGGAARVRPGSGDARAPGTAELGERLPRRAPTGNPRSLSGARRSESLGTERARSAPPGSRGRCRLRTGGRAPKPARTHLPAAGAPDGGRAVVNVALHHRAAHVHPQHVPRRGGPAVGLPARHRPARPAASAE